MLDELPHTKAAFRSGAITEWRAMLLARETACLSREDRAEVDRRVAGDPDVLEVMGDGEIVARAREAAYELDPVSFVERRRRAEGDRRVSLRPAPDVMSQLSALLPVKDGVAVWAVLGREADRARAAGDQRSRGQIMADTLVRRVLSPGEGAPSVPLLINVVVPDSVLLGDDDGFGWVQHYGPVPGDLLREWIAANAEQGVDQWVRRLYASPKTGELVSMDSKSRRFEGALADYLRLRDRQCRTRYCDAPVRHLDHAKAHADGGPTSAANGQGLCEYCNYAKDALGWSARPRPGPRHTIETVTPTGHRYTSTRAAVDGGRARAAGRAGWVRAHGLSPARAPASGCRSSCPGPGRSRVGCRARMVGLLELERPGNPDDLGGVTRGEHVICLLSQSALLFWCSHAVVELPAREGRADSGRRRRSTPPSRRGGGR